MKKLKPPKQPAHRRAILQSTLNQSMDSPSAKALGKMMHGYHPQGVKPSTGTRLAPRGHLVRQSTSSGLTMSIDHSIDRMVASALVGGPHTTGVLSSLFGLSPNLTGR
jgi:hypothetical protein